MSESTGDHFLTLQWTIPPENQSVPDGTSDLSYPSYVNAFAEANAAMLLDFHMEFSYGDGK